MPILLGYIYIQGETKKNEKYTFLQRNFYPQLLSFTENLMQTVFIDGKVPLVLGLLVCLWMSSFIYKYLVIRPITIAPLYAYIF